MNPEETPLHAVFAGEKVAPAGDLAWVACSVRKPPDDVVVETKIDDGHGCRNVQPLKRMKGNRLWWTPDSSMYVYYEPTHWRRLPTPGETKT